MTTRTLEKVTAELNRRGITATLENPGYITVDGINYGTATPAPGTITERRPCPRTSRQRALEISSPV